MITIRTKPCIVCNLASLMTLTPAEMDRVEKWYNGEVNIQDAFPEWDQNRCELLKTGIHSECWDKLFAESDD